MAKAMRAMRTSTVASVNPNANAVADSAARARLRPRSAGASKRHGDASDARRSAIARLTESLQRPRATQLARTDATVRHSVRSDDAAAGAGRRDPRTAR